MLWEWENGANRVYILDLDGTLMPTAEIDNVCFWQAVAGVFGAPHHPPDLHDFVHITDSGILHEWCAREVGRPPSADEAARIKRLFEQRLQSAFHKQPAHFSPLPGVMDWLTAIRASGHAFAGIATGGWAHSARLKLKLSGLDRFALPLASSDDAVRRPDIMRIAASRTMGHASRESTVFTYVGDGVWDLQASRELSWEFVGIASGARALLLESAGATLVRENFCKT